jgi:triosephosphate isomerase
MRRTLIAGNWKMNGRAADTEVLDDIVRGAADAPADILVCPPATLIARFAERAGNSAVAIGGQDCHPEPSGAHTGDVSAGMLADAGARAVILGHSERRADHHETDALVRAKTGAAWRAGLLAVVCVGETEAERDAGRAGEVVAAQLAGSVPDGATPERLAVAYEPVWAIGTGRTAGAGEIVAMHGAIRASLSERFGEAAGAEFRLLYGGSVKPENAAAILALEEVDGALVGGASLRAADFLAIVAAG